MAILDTTTHIMQSAWKFFRRGAPAEGHASSEGNAGISWTAPVDFPPITLYIYDHHHYREVKVLDFDTLFRELSENRPKYKIWMDIEGRGKHAFIQQIGKHFKWHELEVEDLMSLHQRPKAEEYDEHLFVVSRMIYFSKSAGTLINEQVSFFIYEDILITFQEEHEDAFDGVREKLRKNHSGVCTGNMFFLAWSLMDAIIDQYFSILERIGNDLERIESLLLSQPQRQHLLQIQSVKREIMFLRKAILAERDKFAELDRHENRLVDDRSRIYLRDTYDHTAQIMDIIESHKEISYSLMEVYMSAQNNRMSEVMKVLTVISSIFIPLTFIVGVYGMNFSYKSDDGSILKYNMPELYHPYGYPGVLFFMALIALVQIIYFKRRKWL